MEQHEDTQAGGRSAGAPRVVSDTLFEGMLERAKKDTRRTTLGNLKAACDSLVSGGKAINISAVEKEAERLHKEGLLERPGPCRITISRDKELNGYVTARKSEQEAEALRKGRTPKKTFGAGSSTAKIQKAIKDPDAVILFIEMCERVKRTEADLERAKALISSLDLGDDPGETLRGNAAASFSQETISIPHEGVEALGELVSVLGNDSRLSGLGLVREETGRISRRDTLKTKFLSAEAVDGLAALLSSLRSASPSMNAGHPAAGGVSGKDTEARHTPTPVRRAFPRHIGVIAGKESR